MTNIPQQLLQRNEAYARGHQPRPPLPLLNTIVLSCVDARIDPAHVLGLAPGEAVVLRNAGGRVTEAVEQDIALLIAMASRAMKRPAKPEIVLIHHTDCGVERLCDDSVAEGIGGATGIPLDTLRQLAIHDHNTSLRQDFDRLAASPHIPAGPRVTALRYEQTSGRAAVAFQEELS